MNEKVMITVAITIAFAIVGGLLAQSAKKSGKAVPFVASLICAGVSIIGIILALVFMIIK